MDPNAADRRLTPVPRLSQMSPLSRREFLRRMSYTALFVAGGSTLLAACGDGDEAAGCTFDSTNSGDNKTINFANWPFYIDVLEDGWFDTTSLGLPGGNRDRCELRRRGQRQRLLVRKSPGADDNLRRYPA